MTVVLKGFLGWFSDCKIRPGGAALDIFAQDSVPCSPSDAAGRLVNLAWPVSLHVVGQTETFQTFFAAYCDLTHFGHGASALLKR